ncbi:flagellar biosynthesis protein FliQ [soil metagenome]
MNPDQVLDLWRSALSVVVQVSAPFLLACLGVGLAVAIIQTATQLQESTLSFLPKLGVALVVVALSGHWALDKLGAFTKEAFNAHVDATATSLVSNISNTQEQEAP